MAKRKLDPETKAEWAEGQRRIAEMLDRRERLIEERAAWDAARKARLRRLTFGLLGR